MCSSSTVIQPLLHTSATLRHKRAWSGHIHPLPSRWVTIWPQTSDSKDQNTEEFSSRGAVCRDCAPMVHNEHHLHVIIEKLSVAEVWLNGQPQQTVVFHKPAPATFPEQPCITIDSTKLKNVESFMYLRSILFQMTEPWTGKSHIGFRKLARHSVGCEPRS